MAAHRQLRRLKRDWDSHRAALPVQGSSSREQQSDRSEEHTSELQSLMRISYAVFCLKNKSIHNSHLTTILQIQLITSVALINILAHSPLIPQLSLHT